MLDHTLRIRLRNGATNDARLLERWRSVLASFVVVNWRADKVAMRPPVSQPSVSLVDRIKRMVQGPKSEEAVTDVVVAEETPPGKPIDERVLVVLRAEGAADAFVRAICFSIENRLAADLRRGERRQPKPQSLRARAKERRHGERRMIESPRTMPEQLLDEIAERTATCYAVSGGHVRSDEQLVLAEIAHEGFVNYKSRRTVRRLLGRGLIVKAPSFQLMNETFRRFVLSPPCQGGRVRHRGRGEPEPVGRSAHPVLRRPRKRGALPDVHTARAVRCDDRCTHNADDSGSDRGEGRRADGREADRGGPAKGVVHNQRSQITDARLPLVHQRADDRRAGRDVRARRAG